LNVGALHAGTAARRVERAGIAVLLEDPQVQAGGGSDLRRAPEGPRRAGLIRGTKIKQWVFYQRDEGRIAAAKELLSGDW
jgi:hypothetical protein